MKIGIDLTPLQGPHRMRGIGATLINFINHLPTEERAKNELVFFTYPSSARFDNPLDLLDLEGLNYEVRTIQPVKKSHHNFPGKLHLLNGVINFLNSRKELWLGDARINNADNLDWFLQFDQSQPLPAKRHAKSALVVYDLIPYVMEPDYLWSYKTARAKGCSRKGSIRHMYHRRNYLTKLKLNTRKASKLIAISQHTKKDFVKYLGIKPSKITVCLLGVDKAISTTVKEDQSFEKYVKTSWGYLPKKTTLKREKFLLFIGGADPRRKLVDLVAAYNNLRAQGENIKLVFAGDTMQGAFDVPNIELQKYLKHTSFLDDIYFLGFVSNQQREWLYQHAIAFVYPSVYEGFGLPILEAMQYGTPVITYKNSSIPEVGGDAAIYANNHLTITKAARELLAKPALREKYANLGKSQAAKFAWDKTTSQIVRTLAS